MNQFSSLYRFNPTKKTVVTLGTFDGVHLGHQKVIQKLVQNAKKFELESVILTFFPHPQQVLNPATDLKMLSTVDEKTRLLTHLGLDNLIIHPFDATFSELLAEEFVSKILVDQLKVQKIIIGYDHRFGKNRTANFADLQAFGKKYNFEVEQISAEEMNEMAVSSTKIRKAIQNNDFALVKQFLGRFYSFSGKVIEGKQLGRTLGFPTANLAVDQSYKMIPNSGVYAVLCEIDPQKTKKYQGVMNIGNRPTVDGTSQTIEIHLFDFNENIYNQEIKVYVCKQLRLEQKFNSIDDLKIQIAKDKKTTEAYFKSIEN